MANRTVKDAHTVKGTNPQYLIEKIIRSRIYDCKYWKEECFALTAELLVDKAMELRYVGGVYAGNIKPAPFLCLTLKMLQIQPEKDIVIEFIKNEDFKYVRALGAFYLRLIGSSMDCYKYLEPLLNDYRKIRIQDRDGKFRLSHMDEFIDELLREERSCDVIMPRIQKRYILEEANEIEPRVSLLEADDLDEDDIEDDDEEEEQDGKGRDRRNADDDYMHTQKRSDYDDRDRRDRRRSRSRSRERDRDRRTDRIKRDRSHSRDRKRRRSRSRSRERNGERRDRSERSQKDRERDRRSDSDRKNRDRGSGGGGAGKDDLSVEETNKLRASLGLAPLK